MEIIEQDTTGNMGTKGLKELSKLSNDNLNEIASLLSNERSEEGRKECRIAELEAIDQILDERLSKIFLRESKMLSDEVLCKEYNELQKKDISLYQDDYNSNYWQLRLLLLKLSNEQVEKKQNLLKEKIKTSVYMRYGGKELAISTLEEVMSSPNIQEKIKIARTLEEEEEEKKKQKKKQKKNQITIKILNVGSGFGSDIVEQIVYLQKQQKENLLPVNINFRFVGVEYNQKYADISMKIFTALGLDRYVCIYVADLSNEDSMNNIKKQELGFDGAYSTLVILHIPDKKQTYQNVCNLLNANSYFRNEDYHTNKDTDTEFASLNIGCNNLMSKEQMNEMAEEIGFINVKYVNYQKEWSKFVQKRASTLQDLANEKFKLGKGVSSQKLQFVIAVDDYFTNKSGDGGVFLMQKKVF